MMMTAPAIANGAPEGLRRVGLWSSTTQPEERRRKVDAAVCGIQLQCTSSDRGTPRVRSQPSPRPEQPSLKPFDEFASSVVIVCVGGIDGFVAGKADRRVCQQHGVALRVSSFRTLVTSAPAARTVSDNGSSRSSLHHTSTMPSRPGALAAYRLKVASPVCRRSPVSRSVARTPGSNRSVRTSIQPLICIRLRNELSS